MKTAAILERRDTESGEVADSLAKRSAGSVLVLRPEVSSSEGPSRGVQGHEANHILCAGPGGCGPLEFGEVGQAEWWEFAQVRRKSTQYAQSHSCPGGGPLHDQTWVKCVNAPIGYTKLVLFFF